MLAEHPLQAAESKGETKPKVEATKPKPASSVLDVITVDLDRRTFDKKIPLDVPFLIEGKIPAEVKQLEAHWVRSFETIDPALDPDKLKKIQAADWNKAAFVEVLHEELGWDIPPDPVPDGVTGFAKADLRPIPDDKKNRTLLCTCRPSRETDTTPSNSPKA